MRKPDFCLWENKGADQLCNNCTADQCLCFRYTDNAISLLPKSNISRFWPFSETVQLDLCRTWSETTKTGFLTSQLMFYHWLLDEVFNKMSSHYLSYKTRNRNTTNRQWTLPKLIHQSSPPPPQPPHTSARVSILVSRNFLAILDCMNGLPHSGARFSKRSDNTLIQSIVVCNQFCVGSSKPHYAYPKYHNGSTKKCIYTDNNINQNLIGLVGWLYLKYFLDVKTS